MFQINVGSKQKPLFIYLRVIKNILGGGVNKNMLYYCCDGPLHETCRYLNLDTLVNKKIVYSWDRHPNNVQIWYKNLLKFVKCGTEPMRFFVPRVCYVFTTSGMLSNFKMVWLLCGISFLYINQHKHPDKWSSFVSTNISPLWFDGSLFKHTSSYVIYCLRPLVTLWVSFLCKEWAMKIILQWWIIQVLIYK